MGLKGPRPFWRIPKNMILQTDGRFEWPDGSVYDGEFRNNNAGGP